MIDLDFTFFVQLVNFLLILSVLNLVLYRPIRGIIKKRAEIMDEKLGSINGFTADAEAKLANYAAALSGSRTEAQAVRMALREEGQAAETDVLSVATNEAAQKIAVARQDIDAQKQSALKALRAEVAGYAKDVAHKVLSRA
ncbi:MAG: ATP synthase F0 subunit B [Desulfovibrionales bacterium]|nr:ATP synthase F0 subunit B [Desulfovibrionales bacterium]